MVASTNQQFPIRRQTKKPWQHLYNTRAWRDRIRVFVLARDPICMICERAPSTVVDHIVDHKGDPKLFFDAKNCRGLCKPCHDERTAAESGGFGHAAQPAGSKVGPDVIKPTGDWGKQYVGTTLKGAVDDALKIDVDDLLSDIPS
jgi:5-methylcytosine-specific restriction endonuclease McrA